MAPEIDDMILAELGQRWRKVAMVIAQVAEKLGRDGNKDSDWNEIHERIGQRLSALVADGRIEGVGDVSNWRHSEVRRGGNCDDGALKF